MTEMQAQAYICPWCCDDHSNNNDRCRDAYLRGAEHMFDRIKKKSLEAFKEVGGWGVIVTN